MLFDGYAKASNILDEFSSGVDKLPNPNHYIVWNMNMSSPIHPECANSFKMTSDLEESVFGKESKVDPPAFNACFEGPQDQVKLHTGPKTRRKIQEAEGGILFVDEAYRLIPMHKSDDKDYGLEALEEIMSVMDSGKVVIFAGYSEPMKRVISSNEGF